jgi:hypothetical protein
VNDIDWTSPAEAALALARVVNTWRSHLERAQSSRERAAELRKTGSPAPAGLSEADWRAFPDLLDAQAGEWDAAAAIDAGEYREAVAQAIAGGRLTRAQASQLTSAETVDAADLAVLGLKREVF